MFSLFLNIAIKQAYHWAMVVAQLVERLLWMPEVRGSNLIIGKLLYRTFICLLLTVLKRQK